MLKKDIITKKTSIIEEDKKISKPKSSWKDFVLSIIYSPLLIVQFVLVFIYYNYYTLGFLTWIGWIIFVFFMVVGGLPRRDFNKYGRVQKGRSFIYTTKLVDKGVYAIIRHPQWLCWILLSLAVTFMSQHWIMVILALPACLLIYGETFLLDKGLIKKFGEEYRMYKKKVPRMNLILGIIKHLKRNKKHIKKEI